MKTILIGTSNKAKVAEVHKYLGDLAVDWKALSDVAPGFDVQETGDSFEANAAQKAVETARHTGMPAIGADSGLIIPALDGWPGLHTRRIQGEKKATDEEIIRVASERIATIPEADRAFRFVSAVAFALPDDTVTNGLGELVGTLTLDLHPNPSVGFPFRRFWYIPRFQKYFLDLTEEEEDMINHNKIALDQLRPAIEDYLKS